MCVSHLSYGVRRGLAIGDQGVNVLNVQAGIGLIKADRFPVRTGREIDELLKVLSAWGGRCAFGELEQEIEDLPDVFGEVGDVGVEIAIVDGKKTDLTVFERDELREVRCADAVQVARDPMGPQTQ